MVYTDYRPTPLQHFIFPSGGEGVFLVVDDKGKFREDNFHKAMAILSQGALEDDPAGGKGGAWALLLCGCSSTYRPCACHCCFTHPLSPTPFRCCRTWRTPSLTPVEVPSWRCALHCVSRANGFPVAFLRCARCAPGAGGGGGKGKAKGGKGGKGGGKGGPSDLFRIVKMIMDRNYDPVIVFSFSKRECETYALQLAQLDFTSDDEKKVIRKVFVNAIDSLSDDDKMLPQVRVAGCLWVRLTVWCAVFTTLCAPAGCGMKLLFASPCAHRVPTECCLAAVSAHLHRLRVFSRCCDGESAFTTAACCPS